MPAPTPHPSPNTSPNAFYMPIVPPPTPAPSPPPGQSYFRQTHPSHVSRFAMLSPASRRQHLYALIQECTPSELLFLSTTITPLLKRDFLRALPPEVSLHILSFVDDPRTLGRAARVSRYWNELLKDDCLWKAMCIRHGFSHDPDAVESFRTEQGLDGKRRRTRRLSLDSDFDSTRSTRSLELELQPPPPRVPFPYRRFFIYEHLRR
uniref:Glucanase (EC) n=1 Tax=Ganoderma boninense TaxID=34458 RepID=A0A5K1K4H7_9APHY|nr:Glucanase (EC [Ganoderma boninense]